MWKSCGKIIDFFVDKPPEIVVITHEHSWQKRYGADVNKIETIVRNLVCVCLSDRKCTQMCSGLFFYF